VIVENSIGAADDRLAVSVRIPGKANSRLDVVLVGLNSLLKIQIVIPGCGESCGRFESGGNLYIVAKAIVQRNPAVGTPGVLPVQADRNVGKRVAGRSQALYVRPRNSGAVCLNRR